MTDNPFKVGDKVRPIGLHQPVTRTVLAVHPTGVWLTREPSDPNYEMYRHNPPITASARNYEKVPQFFEAGKTYTRLAAWSIPAQANDVTEYFECTVVEVSRNGSLYAFGRFSIPREGMSGQSCDEWVVMGGYEWRTQQWEETP